MRSRPSATRTWLSLSGALLVLAGCGGAREQEVRAQTTQPAVTYVSADGIRFARGAERPTEGLSPLGWHEIDLADGRLHLRFERCLLVHQVEVGPPEDEFRRVTVWGERPREIGKCTHAIELTPPSGWTRATIAAPEHVVLPNPDRTDDRHTETGGGVLQPDRRTLLVGYSYGGCGDVAETDARLDGSTITVSVTTGYRYDDDEGTSCSDALFGGTTIARLPEPAPPGAVVAPPAG